MARQYGMSCYRKDRYLDEQQRISKFAPRIFCRGPHIRGYEELFRMVYSPEDVFENKKFKPESISREDLSNRGFSIQRVKYSHRGRVEELIGNYVARKNNRAFEYLLLFQGDDVRQIKDDEGYQAFVIVDDACIPEDIGHALIFCAAEYKKSHVKELREQLAAVISTPRKIDEVLT